jgi:hypothetical protein
LFNPTAATKLKSGTAIRIKRNSLCGSTEYNPTNATAETRYAAVDLEIPSGINRAVASSARGRADVKYQWNGSV